MDPAEEARATTDAPIAAESASAAAGERPS
jgi:hypothetical protein